jgi:hypothetical protein
MKKYVWLLAGLLVGSYQMSKAQNVGGGLSAAAVFSQIDGDAWGGYNKFGYSLGGFAWYDFSDRWSLMPEITFSHRGSRETVKGYGQYSLNLIDVPLLLRYRIFGSPGAQSLLLEAGPSANILLSARNGFAGEIRQNLMPQFNKLGVSINVGADFFFNRHIAIVGRWTYAMTNLNKGWRQSREYWRCHFITVGLKIAFK